MKRGHILAVLGLCVAALVAWRWSGRQRPLAGPASSSAIARASQSTTRPADLNGAVLEGIEISCIVRDTNGAAGVAYLKFEGQGDPIIVATGSDGVWRGELPPGRYIATAATRTAMTGMPLVLRVPLPAAERCEPTLNAEGVLIEGRVVDMSGEPIANATVDATSLQGVTLTPSAAAGVTFADERGQFALLVRPGAVRLRGMHPAYAVASTVLQVALPRADVVLTLQPGSAISGRVQRADAQAVPGAMVVLQREQSRWQRAVRSDAAGEFEFVGLRPGAYEIRASDGTAVTLAPTLVQLENFEAATELVLTLATGYALAGRVVNEQGEGVAEATIRSAQLSLPVVTDEAGTFAISGVAPGVVQLAAEARGYATREPVEVAVANRDVLDARIVVGPARVLRGRVEPAGPAHVWLDEASVVLDLREVQTPTGRMTQADARGYFVFEQVRDVEVNLFAKAPDGGTGTAARGDVAAGQEIIIRLTPRASLHGRVVDERGQPQPHLRVGVLPIGHEAGQPTPLRVLTNGRASLAAETMTASDGSFALMGLAAGPVVFQVADAQGAPFALQAPLALSVGEGEQKRDVVVRVASNTASLQVTVVDGGGAPVHDAWVEVACEATDAQPKGEGMAYIVAGAEPPQRQALLTDERGRATFSPLAVGRCDVSASSGNGAATAKQHDVVSDASISLTLVAQGALQGTLTPFAPGVVYEVELSDGDGMSIHRQLVSAATFVMRGVPAGTYLATVTAKLQGEVAQDVTISPGQTTAVAFSLVANGTLTGRIVDKDGKPRADVPLWPIRHGSQSIELSNAPPRSDAQGRFTLQRAPGMWLLVEMQPDGMRMLDAGPVQVNAAQVTDVGDVRAVN